MSFENMMRAFESGALRPKTGYEPSYEGRARVAARGVSLPPQARVLEVQAPWAKMATDVIVEVLIPSGFITSNETDVEALRWIEQTWQFNDLDSQFNLAASEAIAVGAAYWVLSPPDEDSDYPYVRALDAKHAAVRLDWQGRLVEGIAVYRVDADTVGATHYLPDGVVYYRRDDSSQEWLTDGTGRMDTWGPSIVPMYNRARLSDKYGRSDIAEMASLVDAASRTLTNIQVGQEVAAWPLRLLIGDHSAQILDSMPDTMQAYIGNIMAAPAGSDIKQLTGVDMTPIQNIYRLYALQISAMTGIPPSMMGVSADSNPTSAEALRVAKDRLIARAENKQRQFADSLEQIARAICVMGGYDLEDPTALEVQWRDAAAPSVSAMMASALQAQAQGVLSSQTARDFMMLSPQQREREDARSQEVDEMAGAGVADRALRDQEDDTDDPDNDTDGESQEEDASRNGRKEKRD